MADGSSPETPRKITTRRKVIGAIAGLTGLIWAGKPESASAQTITKPVLEIKPDPPAQKEAKYVDQKQIIIDSDKDDEDEKVPKGLKERVDKAIDKARNYLQRKDVKVKFNLVNDAAKLENKANGAYSTYETKNPLGIAGGEELSDYQADIYYQANLSEGDEEYLALRAAAEVAKITNRKSTDENNPQGYILGRFKEDFKKNAGFDIEFLDSESPEATPVIMPVVTEGAELKKGLKMIFEFMNYTDGRHRVDIYEQLMEPSERLYTRGLALWLLKSDELVKKVRASSYSPQTQAAIANIFLSILKHSSSSLPLDVSYESGSGVNQKDLDKMLELSGDPKLKEFFKEKRDFSGLLPKAA